MTGTDLGNCHRVRVSRDLFIPIFVMARDRVTSLRESLQSYQDTINSPFEIIVLDHRSTFPPMVRYLNHIKDMRGISVVALMQERWSAALKEANALIRQYLNRRPDVLFYVYTDPDIVFLRTAPDVLLFYAALLSSCPELKVVGPGLQISDIPSHFNKSLPNGQTVHQRHSRFWTSVPNIATWNGLGYHIAKHPIDTTFSMFRRDTPFKRLTQPSVRTYAPYSAVHIDWYHDSTNLSADKLYYTSHQSGINNW